MNSTTGKKAYELSLAQVMIKRKKTFLIGGNVRRTKRSKRERKNALTDMTMRPEKRKTVQGTKTL